MLVFDVKIPFFEKKHFFRKNDPKMLFFQKKILDQKIFFGQKCEKANFSIKNGFLVVKKGFGAQNGRKWSKNG